MAPVPPIPTSFLASIISEWELIKYFANNAKTIPPSTPVHLHSESVGDFRLSLRFPCLCLRVGHSSVAIPLFSIADSFVLAFPSAGAIVINLL